MALARDTEPAVVAAVVAPLVVEKLGTSKPTPDAKCTQCGKTIRHMAMFLKNVTCRDCYGLERYGRAPVAGSPTENSIS